MTTLMLRHSAYWGRELLDSDTDVVLIDLIEADVPAALAGRYSRIYRVESWSDMAGLSLIAGDLIASGVDVRMVYSPTELTQFAAGYLRTALSATPNPLSVVLATRDKRVMKNLAAKAGLRVTNWETVHADRVADDLARVAEQVGFPLVAKPVNGFGTQHTDVIESPEQLADYARRAFDGKVPSATDMFVCERFVPGAEYHADALLDGGRIVSILVSRYLVNPRDLRAGAGPDLSIGLDEQTHPRPYEAVREGLTRFIREAGLTDGPVHFEFFADPAESTWTPDGLVFSEIASRIGGGNIADLVGAYCGVNLRMQTLAQGLGDDLGKLPWRRVPSPVVGLLNLIPTRSGTITGLPVPDRLSAEPDVLFASVPAKVGAHYEVGVSTATWTAVVVFAAQSEQALVERARTLVARYPIHVE
ncbi:ATP-grasp domain-containing protein [Solwaraspora sp. WMMD1047]|uniref:ATP-grasp domain-containing protein n=1 Tax=Solwaraspora sp. WMMD1047 TaxID=3016102 RepID=UPI0024159CAD|nr:ATP-grasp domain-containing protein [Solwaraspora sp. WMMD1047]MDG4829588.1 ATP-grasp domain-containing protein [Solwaraspora sp. WMMD1047]